MKIKNGYFILGAGICLFAALSIFSQAFASGVSKGLDYCVKLLIPSVFPFLIAASLTGRGSVPEFLCKILNPVTKLIFGLPARCMPAVILSLFGGYLSGAKTVQSLYANGITDRQTAERMMFFCVNAGLGFSVNAVGSGMLDSRYAGKVIFSSLCISSLIIGLACRLFFGVGTEIPRRNVSLHTDLASAVTESVSSGGAAMLNACAFTVAFSGICAVFDRYIPHPLLKNILSCLLEVTKGCADISTTASLPVIAAVCAFGGVCVHFQVFSSAKDIGINLPRFYIFRLLNSAAAYAVCRLILFFFPAVHPVSVIINPPEAVFSFSAPAAVSLLFLCALLILDLDNGEKIC